MRANEARGCGRLSTRWVPLRLGPLMVVAVMVPTACSDGDDPVEPSPPPDVEVIGTVTAAHDGQGIEGAQIAAYEPGGTQALDQAVTTSDGSYQLEFTEPDSEPDQIRLEAAADGFENLEETVPFALTMSGDLSLTALEMEVTIQGDVVEQLTGDAVDGAEVEVSRPDEADPLAEGTSGAGGSYQLSFTVLEVEAPDRIQLEAEGAGYDYQRELDFDPDLTHDIAVGPFAGGRGTASSPYEIANADHLQAVDQDLAGHFLQVADVDASGSAGWNGGAGFEPLGHWEGTGEPANEPFSGTFDGSGHSIAGLTIDRPGEDGQGLFAFLEGGTVQDVSVENADVTGNESVGALVARVLDGAVFEASVSGSVTGNDGLAGGLVGGAQEESEIVGSSSTADVEAAGTGVGGLVGGLGDASEVRESTASGPVDNAGPTLGFTGGLVGFLQDEAVVEASSAGGDVESSGSYSGGLVGGILEDARIETSSAAGDVDAESVVGGLVGGVLGSDTRVEASYATGTAEGEDYVGGLAGGSSGEIRTSYSTARVIGAGQTHGGLVGANGDDGEIRESFSAGPVAGNAPVGGFIGTNAGSVSFGYWDADASEQDYAVGSGSDGSITGLETSEMTGDDAEANMGGLDFDDDWDVAADAYPVLWWQESP